MTNSALLGDPPATSRDAMIRKGMQSFITAFNPVPTLPFGPKRPTPDLAGESNAYKVKTTSATALTLVLVITIGRFWRRFKTPDWKAGPDDYFIIGGSIVAVAYIAQIMAYFPDGNCYGKHMWFCTYEDLQSLYLSFTVGQTIFYFSVYCSKLSLLYFIRRLTSGSGSRFFEITHWVLFLLLVVIGCISLFVTAFQCIPVKARWSWISLSQVNRSDYHCINALQFQLACRGMHMGTDFILLIYPLLVLRTLQMPLKKKVGISLVFSFGLLCIVCSIMRNIVFGQKYIDYTYESSQVFIWNIIDIGAAAIVPSLPAYYTIFASTYDIVRKTMGVHSTTSGSYGSKSGGRSEGLSFAGKVLRSDRHAPISQDLEGVKGPYYISPDAKSLASATTVTAGLRGNRPRYDGNARAVRPAEFELEER